MGQNRLRRLILSTACAVIVLWGTPVTTVAKDKDEKKEKGQRWALLIGIDDYSYAKDLKYCVADQAALQKELLAAGFDPRQVILLTDDAKDRRRLPTVTNIRQQIELICGYAEPGDLVLISFSGHGVLIGTTSYLCPADARLHDPEALISLDWIYETMQSCKADLKLVMVDACRNIPPDLGEKRAAGSPEFKDSARAFVRASERLPEGILLLNSCSEGEFAQEDEKLGHGVFMHFLLEALRGKADDNRDRQVTLDEVFKFVSRETKLYVGDKFAELQRPKLRGNLTLEVLDYQLARIAPDGRPQLPAPRPSSPGAGPPLLTAPFTSGEARNAQGAWARFLSREVVEKNSLGMTLTLVPAGEFQMGNGESLDETIQLAHLTGWKAAKDEDFENEYPLHRVRIMRPYYLGVHEVTKGQFRKFVDATSYRTEAEKDGKGWGYDGDVEKQGPKFTWRNWGVDQADESPVVNVSWNDAMAFCEWLSAKEGKQYRLPSEAEWEFACRAGTTTRYNHGDDPEQLTSVGNVADATLTGRWSRPDAVNSSDGYAFPCRVGLFRPNAFGLYDMHGNVYEWCADWYEKEYYATSPKDNPEGPLTGTRRIYRGSSSLSNPAHCRSAFRYGGPSSFCYCFMGFRVVLSPLGK